MRFGQGGCFQFTQIFQRTPDLRGGSDPDFLWKGSLNMDNVKVACVGTGYWGKNLVRNFYGLPGCALKVCCDLNDKNLKAISGQYPGVAVTTDYDTVLCNPDIDAVVLASPAVQHYEMAKQALEARKHVYVEKPLTLRVGDAEVLCDLADANDRVLMVGHLMEYHPGVVKLKQLVDYGELGEVYYLYSQRVNLGIVRKDENALWSLAPHDISIILYLLDQEPVTVSARGATFLQSEIEDVVFCNLQFANGAMAQIQVSWLDPHKARKITVVGSKKMVVFDDVEATEKVRIYDKGVDGMEYASYGDALTLRSGDITIPRIDMAEPLRAECQHFVMCIQKGEKPRSDGRNGLRVVRVLDAADRSLKDRGVPVALAK
jgi:predicted dehydrogenase